ncbi:hypothetical protein N0V93_009611 [Gnomoniopsis smithogilvyi]|uniref:Uncharacterized protein n=1 Tax=Gnomoniopsis smithogilvyi TaxID=1191159 RepID=A0A9W9CTU2_9PEZI|nr:hypothetical protein N0V93_009611 [Gnomoniopsis smithogilvyi]
MKLTPIKVRGKRGQPKLSKGYLDNGTCKGKEIEAPGWYGQPEAKRAKKHHARFNDGIGGTLMMSKAIPRLLQLPQEVLERVFIASKNLALPLVNHELCRRLSTDSIKYQLVGAAFGPTWHAWYGLDNAQVHSYHGWNSDTDRSAGDAAFQSTILACSWAKLPLLLTSFDVWIRKHSLGRPYFTVPKMSEERLRQAPEPGSLYDWAYRDIDLKSSKSLHCPDMTMRQKLAFDLENFQAFIATQRMHARTNAATTGGQVYSPAQEHLRALLGMHLEVHPGAIIPNDLLSGPYESEDDESIAIGQEKAQRLFWLVRGGACLQEDQTWEATRDGFKAILQLIKGSTNEATSARDGEDRLMLATELFFLFSLLGVFALQWPKYVLQTILGHVTSLIPMFPTHSKQQFELGEIASALRVQGRANLPLERELQLALYRNLCASRSDLFLLAPNTDGLQAYTSVASSQRSDAGDATGLMHEPWSDFGIG